MSVDELTLTELHLNGSEWSRPKLHECDGPRWGLTDKRTGKEVVVEKSYGEGRVYGNQETTRLYYAIPKKILCAEKIAYESGVTTKIKECSLEQYETIKRIHQSVWILVNSHDFAINGVPASKMKKVGYLLGDRKLPPSEESADEYPIDGWRVMSETHSKSLRRIKMRYDPLNLYVRELVLYPLKRKN